MRFKITCLIAVIFLTAVSITFGNGLSLNSIGPKSLGMGGAFIGLADDYTAVYWNPAGITNLDKMQIAAFVTDIIPSSTYKYVAANGMTIADAKSKTNHYISPNLAGYIPLMKGDLVVGLGAYAPAGLGAEWDGSELKAFQSPTDSNTYNWKSFIRVFNISPVVAYKINDMISVGASLNLYYGMFDLEQYSSAQYKESSTGLGFGGSLGILIKPAKIINIGLSFKTENNIKFEGTANNPALTKVPNTPAETDFSRDVSWPLWFGGGIAFFPIENLTLALDFQYSMWSKTEDSIVTDYKNPNWKTYAAKSSVIYLLWKDALQIRFGVQYDLSKEFALRLGYYYDPAPAPFNTLTILFPSQTYNTFTIGASYKLSNQFNIDFGAEYLMGTERDIPAGDLENPDPDYNKNYHAMPGKHNTNIIAVSLGLCMTLD
ncbi:MAG: outer membrane protein transport protein [Ignavibacteriae bacterium]|nr:outer membrane protein transport protein [Ignavibacteriota bacterium]